MSLTCPGRTAAARAAACSGATPAARPLRSAQSMLAQPGLAQPGLAQSWLGSGPLAAGGPVPGASPAARAASAGTWITSLRSSRGPPVRPLGMASRLSAAAAARRAASRSVPRNGPVTISARAWLRLITSSASGPVNRVLTGTSVAPA